MNLVHLITNLCMFKEKKNWFMTSRDLILHCSDNVCLLTTIPLIQRESNTLVSSGGCSNTTNLNPLQNNTASQKEVECFCTIKMAVQPVHCLLLKCKLQGQWLLVNTFVPTAARGHTVHSNSNASLSMELHKCKTRCKCIVWFFVVSTMACKRSLKIMKHMIKGKNKAVPVHAIKPYRRSRGRVPFMLDLNPRWTQVVNFTSQLIYPSKETLVSSV